jgi:hypothetical protein
MKRSDLTGADYVVVENFAAKGARNLDLAVALGVTAADFRSWLMEDNDLVLAIERGQSKMHDDLISVVIKQAMTGDIECIDFLLNWRSLE